MIAIAIARRGTAHELTRPGRAGAPPGEPGAPCWPCQRAARVRNAHGHTERIDSVRVELIGQ
jgi:hypothetical protein